MIINQADSYQEKNFGLHASKLFRQYNKLFRINIAI